MTSAWQLWFLWGVPVGVGTGAMALVFGAIVANRWFVAAPRPGHRLFSAASSTGQLIFLPRSPSWRTVPAGAGPPAWSRSSRCCSCRWCCWCCATGPPTWGELPYGAPASYVEPPVDRDRARAGHGSR